MSGIPSDADEGVIENMRENPYRPDPTPKAQETRQELWERAFRAGKGIDRLLETLTPDENFLLDMLCSWKSWRTFREVKERNNTRMLAELADMMKIIETYRAADKEKAVREAERTAEMAGALKARDVLNREMGIDSHATGAYLIDRYAELQSQQGKENGDSNKL